MEIYCFVLVMGLLMACVLIAIGIGVGRTMDKGELQMGDCDTVLHGGNSDLDNSHVGDDNRKVDSGCDMGQGGGHKEPIQPTTDEIIQVLYHVRQSCGLSSFEKLCIDKAISIIDKLVDMLSKLKCDEDDLK